MNHLRPLARNLSKCRVMPFSKWHKPPLLVAVEYCTRPANTIDASYVFQTISRKLGFKNQQFSHKDMSKSAIRLYLCCADMVDWRQMMDDLELSDTFLSYCRIIGLHAWMVMIRLAKLDVEDGLFLRDHMYIAMMKDFERRAKLLTHSPKRRREGLSEFHTNFQAMIFSYDEGLLSDDRTLAAALWRNMFAMNEVDPKKLALMVEYVRKQTKYMDGLDTNSIVQTGIVNFLPLYGNTEDQKLHVKVDTIMKLNL